MYPEIYINGPTKRTPWIILEPGRIFIMGRSIIEDPGSFYDPVHKWISGYIHNHTGKTQIELGFEYINTGSLKWLYILLRELSDMKNLSNNSSITWHYEQGDDDMYELGLIIKSLVECPFTVIEEEEMSKGYYKKIVSEPH
jgi:endo-1,4-beta-mannosidase